MARVTPIQTNFTAGELSPKLAGRVDLAKYFNGCKTLENFIVHPHGGANRRYGLRYIAETKDSSVKSRLIPFIWNEEQAYILEVGNGYTRFFYDQGVLQGPSGTNKVSNGTFASDTVWTKGVGWSIATGVASCDGSQVAVSNLEQAVTITAGLTYYITLTATVTAGTLTVILGGTAGTTFSSSQSYSETIVAGSGSPSKFIIQGNADFVGTIDDVVVLVEGTYEIVTPFTTAQIPDVKVAQSADVLNMAHQDVYPQILQRNDHNDWSIANAAFTFPELITNGTFDSDTGWTKGTGWTIGAGVATCDGTQTANSDLEQAVGTIPGNRYKVVYTITRSAGTITPNLNDTSGTARAAAGTYTEYILAGSGLNIQFRADADFVGTVDVVTVNYEPFYAANYPSAVSFFEQRLLWAGTPNEPQTIWGSASGSYYDMTTGTDDDDAFIYTIASNRISMIRWMEPHKRLMVGTLGGEWSAGASSSLDPITPTNVRFEQENSFGSSKLQGRLIDNALIFIGRHNKPLLQLSYDYSTDGYKGIDLGLLSPHVFGTGITAFDFQQYPDSILWLAKLDGTFLGLTYYPSEEVLSWHRHSTDGEVESLAVIPGLYGYDEVWMIVKRTINGSTKRYVEMMTGDFEDDIEDAFFVDSGLTYSGVATDTLLGLDHLEGETVQVLANGAVHPNCVVSGGAITLNWEVTKAQVGLPYTSKLETMAMEAGGQDGTAQGKQKRVHRATVRLYNTVGAKLGIDSDTLDTIPFRRTHDRMDQAVALFTGDKILQVPGEWNREGRIWVQQEQPLPITVLSIAYQANVNDL